MGWLIGERVVGREGEGRGREEAPMSRVWAREGLRSFIDWTHADTAATSILQGGFPKGSILKLLSFLSGGGGGSFFFMDDEEIGAVVGGPLVVLVVVGD